MLQPNFARRPLTVAVMLALCAGAALAEDETKLKEVSVSAAVDKPVQQRTELGKLTEYTPLAGSVVGREELETVRFVDSFHELLPRVPGISMSRNLRFVDGAKNYTENRIDGMRARNTGTYTFIDQVNAGDIERVEFIRGPGSVLSGSNAVGGTINVITRNVPAQREAQATGEVFADGGYRTGVTVGAPVSESFGYFVNANRLDSKGWRDHTEQKKDSFSTKLQYRPDTSSRLNFRLEYLHDDYQSPGDLTEAQFKANWRQAQPGTFFRTDIQYVTPSLHYMKMFGESGELNVYAQRRLTDSTANTLGFTSGGGFINDTKSTEDNVQLLYKHMFGPGKGAVTGGVDMMETDSRTRRFPGTAGTFKFIRGAMSSDSISRESHLSPLLQYEVSPLDPLRLTFGVRRDSIEYIIDDQMNNNKDGEKKYGKLVRKFGALYELNSQNFLWLNVAEGFMGPGVSTLIGTGGAAPATPAAARTARYVPTNMALMPEESLTREIGIRGLLGGLKYDTGYYETEFKNLIVATTCALTERCYQRNENAAAAHASGLETALEYPINRYVDLGLTHTYARYTFDNYISAGKDYSGKERYYTPRNHYNLRATFKPAPGWKVELEMDHIDSYYTNQMLTDSYRRPDLYHLRASYTGKTWGFWVHALNLFDAKIPERVTSTEAAIPVRTYTAGYFPLTLRAGVSYNF
jgi:outer membrane receptor protein involved in Fe transport